MKLLGIYDHSGPKYHRILLPITMMDRLQYSMATELTEDNSAGVDVVFFNRMIPKISLNRMIQLREKNGFKLICDLDDHWKLDPSHMLYDQYKHFRTSEIIEECVKISDAITVTHERLYYDTIHYNKNVHILPNAIPQGGQFMVKKIIEDKVRLFWAGGITHRKDIELLRGPARRINRPNVKWVMGGYVAKRKEWDSMSSVFKNGGSFDCELIETLPVTEYYKCYSKCDVSLIPLVDNSFNCYKSNLKILEAANISAPVVVSGVNPYLGFPESLVNYVYRQGDWYKLVTNLINNPAMREDQGRQLREYCDKVYNFESINKHRREVLESVKH